MKDLRLGQRLIERPCWLGGSPSKACEHINCTNSHFDIRWFSTVRLTGLDSRASVWERPGGWNDYLRPGTDLPRRVRLAAAQASALGNNLNRDMVVARKRRRTSLVKELPGEGDLGGTRMCGCIPLMATNHTFVMRWNLVLSVVMLLVAYFVPYDTAFLEPRYTTPSSNVSYFFSGTHACYTVITDTVWLLRNGQVELHHTHVCAELSRWCGDLRPHRVEESRATRFLPGPFA